MFTTIFFCLTILVSLLSQLPSIIESGADAPFKALWPLFFVWMLVRHGATFTEVPLRIFYLLIPPFVLYCMFMHGVSIEPYMGVDCVNIGISLMICCSSYVFMRKYAGESTLLYLGLAVLPAITLLSFSVYVQFLQGYDLTDRVYAYDDKNSLGPILLSGSIVVTYALKSQNAVLNSIRNVLVALVVVVIILLKSRATYVGLFFWLGYLVLTIKSRFYKTVIFALVLATIFFIWTDPEAHMIVVENIILGNRDIDDVNDLSSNRLDILSEALPLVVDNYLLGVGNKYLDCMPIAFVLQYGIIGSLTIFVLLIILFKRIFSLRRENLIFNITYLLFATMLLNALFEARPPFGPGVKCELMWAMIGISFAAEKNMLTNEFFQRKQ